MPSQNCKLEVLSWSIPTNSDEADFEALRPRTGLGAEAVAIAITNPGPPQKRNDLLSSHDLIIVGAGIVGLAHALAAARRGKRVLVLDREAQANGASIRNFGFVTVTGQERGYVWNLAARSAAIWREIAGPAGIAIEQNGLLLVAQRPEAVAVIDAFLATEMGASWKSVV